MEYLLEQVIPVGKKTKEREATRKNSLKEWVKSRKDRIVPCRSLIGSYRLIFHRIDLPVAANSRVSSKLSGRRSNLSLLKFRGIHHLRREDGREREREGGAERETMRGKEVQEKRDGRTEKKMRQSFLRFDVDEVNAMHINQICIDISTISISTSVQRLIVDFLWVSRLSNSWRRHLPQSQQMKCSADLKSFVWVLEAWSIQIYFQIGAP